MDTQNDPKDLLSNEFQGMPKLSSGLNVLTILTFIGCAIQLCFDVYGYFNAKQSFDDLDKIKERMNSGAMPSWARSLIGDPDNLVLIVTKKLENRLPLLILSLTAIALCFWGALQMRKLKKQGYLVYVIGELLPFLTFYLLIGSVVFSGLFFFVGVGFVGLFILLYNLHRKYLVY